MTSRSGLQSRHFNPRSPRGGATLRYAGQYRPAWISIHAPHEGERLADRMKDRLRGQFQSTLPTRGSDVRDACHPLAGVDISIHAPHEGERPFPLYRAAAIRTISIHAPHEGERPTRPETADGNICISIHAPHEGERPGRRRRKSCSPSYFNPRSPRGGATIRRSRADFVAGISIHAPHEGERLSHGNMVSHIGYFNPRSPRGGATFQRYPLIQP